VEFPRGRAGSRYRQPGDPLARWGYIPVVLIVNTRTFETSAEKLVKILNSAHPEGVYTWRIQPSPDKGQQRMLETLLMSIDSRLQKVSEDVGELKVTVTAISKRLDKVEARLDVMDKRFDAMDMRFDAMDMRFDAMDKRFNAMDKRFDAMDKRFDAMDKRLDVVEQTVIRVEQDILRLPTWKSVGAVAATAVAGSGAIVAWLAGGGAKALARLFE